MSRVLEILRLREQGANVSEISRVLKVDRKTVRSYLTRADVVDLGYGEAQGLSEGEIRERFCIERPGPRAPAELDFVSINRELQRPGVTRQLLYEEYLREHPEGISYSRFCANFKLWQQRSEVSYRREYKAGHRCEVDYAGMTVPIYNEATGEVAFSAQIFVATLCSSNRIFAEATRDQSIPCWLGSHVRALSFFGGVPTTIVPDNLKSGVTSACYYDPEINRSYADFAAHYGVVILPTRVKKPQDKAKVESAVLCVERQVLARLRNERFSSLEALNAAMKPLLAELDERVMKGYGSSRRALFEEIEQQYLKPLPEEPFRLGLWKQAKVHIDYHIQLEHSYYSVPHRYAHETVMVRYTDMMVEVFHRNVRIALHQRSYRKHSYVTLKEHMPPAHRYYAEWTPQRFISWAQEIGKETAIQVNSVLLSHTVPEQAYRKCLGLLACQKKYGAERLELACAAANRLGNISPKSIRNMLKNGLETQHLTPQEVDEPPVHHANIRGDIAFH